MSVEISQYTLSRLDDDVLDIKLRALFSIEDKFKSAGPNLENLDVDPYKLIQSLVGWLHRKPVNHEDRVLQLIIAILNSKYKLQVIPLLSSDAYKDIFKQIGRILVDRNHRHLFHEILRIINDYLEREDRFINIVSPREDLNTAIAGTPNDMDPSDSFCYTAEWDVPIPSDRNSLNSMKASLSVNSNDEDIDHALKFFGVLVDDFPAEYFLQPPYIFLSFVKLIDGKETENKTDILNAMLELTKSLARRVKTRKLSKTYIFRNAKNHTGDRKQVTVGTYCMQTFQSVLNLLQEIYTTSRLTEINVCFLALVEIVDLICLEDSAIQPYPTENHYIDAILRDLGYFLKYIREQAMSDNQNKYITYRNNSIYLIYTVCRLIMFRDGESRVSDDIVDLTARTKKTLVDDEMISPMSKLSIQSDRRSNSEEAVATWRSKQGDDESIWRKELEIAALDYPLKHFYPEVHDLLLVALKVDSFSEESTVKVLLNAEEALRPAVALLKDTVALKRGQLIAAGLKAIDVFSIVQSGDLVKRLFEEIINLTGKFDGNEKLRTGAEQLLLRLFCHENDELKRIAYCLASDKMTAFFGDLMGGSKFISKSYATNRSVSNFLGLPLTINILIEIICFGLTSRDHTISSKAENIMMLILRSKSIIPDYWERVCEILVPVLGLLQCFVKSRGKSRLGDLILQLSDPDDNVKLPHLHLIEANVRLLFSREMRIREEAVFRLAYSLTSDAHANRYIPNIESISEVLPNNICLADHIYDSQSHQFNDIYERSYITPMIKLLSSSDVEPSIRRTTLIQLNVMLQDPNVGDHFYNANGLKIILDVLKQSLVKIATQNYADNVIPVVGILAKLCLQKPKARQVISSDVDAYVMLLRALFINHHNEVFKMDCSMVLFLAAYSEFVVGGNDLSMPTVCQRMLVPFKCNYHWKTTAFDFRSPLERFVMTAEGKDDGAGSWRELTGVHGHAAKKKIYWDYIRMAFANLWFGSLEVALGVRASEGETGTVKSLKYTTSNNNRPLAFNQQLHLTDGDLKAIESSWPSHGVAHWITELQNASTHSQVNLACAAIENFLNIDSNGNCGWDFNSLSSAVHRFADITPKGEVDELMFCSVIHLMRTLAERGMHSVIEWFWKSFNKKNCVFLDILCKDKNWSTKLYAENAHLIEIVLARFIEYGAELVKTASTRAEVQKNQEEFRQFFDRIFEQVNTVIDETFAKRDMDKLRCQLSLLRVITSSMQIHCDDYTASFFANKLLRFIVAIKSLSQAGSNFNKNCLLSIGNIMLSVDELKLEKKYLRLLSSLCGHMDFEIRTFSWCILSKVAKTLRGAELLIIELSSLPGGFHACCLSTLLDVHEPSIVRENAAYTFATLISYCDESNNLCERVYPRCADTDPTVMASDPLMIFYVIKQHNFYKDLVVALTNFCPTETIDFNADTDNVPLTSCDLVRSFCVVLASIAGLNSRLNTDFLVEIAIEIMRLVPFISKSVNKSSVLLLTEICTFLCHYLANNRELLERVAAQEVYLIRSLVSLLDISLYEDIRKDAKTVCWLQIVCLLRLLGRTSYGFRAICSSFDGKSFPIVFYFLLNCLAYANTIIPTLKLCTTLFLVGQQEEYDFETFAKRLDILYIDESTTSCLNELCSDDEDEMQNYELLFLLKDERKYASEVLFDYWMNVFQRYKQNPHASESVFKAMEALMKCSHLARAAATTTGLLPQLIEDLDEIHGSLGSNSSDFIRRHGNAKLDKILQKIKLHYNIILSWYSMECLQDTAIIPRLIRSFIRLWPWVSTSHEMLFKFMKLLAILCDDSLPVCKAMTSVVIGNSQSMLQLVATYCTNESSKIKNPQSNLDVLELALRVVSNCCACFEGRNQINKLNIIHYLSRFHPSVTKQQKQYHKITLLWLKFYEIFTRHSDINSGVKHIHLLRSLFEHGQHEHALCALEILRNMSFNVANRTSLLASDDFLYTIKLALDTCSTHVQLLAVTSIWKLITHHFKGRHVIKNSNIYHKLNKLNDQLKKKGGQPMKNEEDEENQQDLKTALEFVLKILST